MTKRLGHLRRKARAFENAALHELMAIFNPWLDAAKAFGKPERNRLFSPHTNVLALLGPGGFGGPFVSRSRPQALGLAGVRAA